MLHTSPHHSVRYVAGMRGAKVPGRGLSAVDELCRQIPVDLSDQKVAVAATRHRLSPTGVKATRDVTAYGRSSDFLYR